MIANTVRFGGKSRLLTLALFMNLHLQSVCLLLQTIAWLPAWLLSCHHLTTRQIASYLREMSVFHSLMILHHLDIDIWEMDP